LELVRAIEAARVAAGYPFPGGGDQNQLDGLSGEPSELSIDRDGCVLQVLDIGGARVGSVRAAQRSTQ
jgi:hypothetical protein